jgi:hypothetical protein
VGNKESESRLAELWRGLRTSWMWNGDDVFVAIDESVAAANDEF